MHLAWYIQTVKSRLIARICREKYRYAAQACLPHYQRYQTVWVYQGRRRGFFDDGSIGRESPAGNNQARYMAKPFTEEMLISYQESHIVEPPTKNKTLGSARAKKIRIRRVCFNEGCSQLVLCTISALSDRLEFSHSGGSAA